MQYVFYIGLLQGVKDRHVDIPGRSNAMIIYRGQRTNIFCNCFVFRVKIALLYYSILQANSCTPHLDQQSSLPLENLAGVLVELYSI